MSSTNEDQRWLEVLAGNEKPRNPQEAQAAKVRQYFQKEEVNAETPDAAALRRVENLLAAKFAAASAAEIGRMEAPTTSLWQRFGSWLAPSRAGHAGRYAAFAALALAVVTLPFLLQPPRTDPDGPESVKGSTKGTTPESVIRSEDPTVEANRFVQVLSTAGVEAQVIEQGDDRVVSAQVPASAMVSVRDRLQSEGHVLPADGRILVRFRRNVP